MRPRTSEAAVDLTGSFSSGIGHREGEMGDMASGQGSTADALELLGEEGRGKLR